MTTTSALPVEHAADPRLSAEGREILARITRGDLQPEFQEPIWPSTVFSAASIATSPTDRPGRLLRGRRAGQVGTGAPNMTPG